MKFHSAALILIAPLTLCAAEKPIPVVKINHAEPVVFEKEIQPIFKNKCTVCHSGKQQKGKFDASSYDSLMKGSKKGVVIVPGKSAESPLVKYAGRTAKPLMPPEDEEPLTPQELALIKLWIDQGAKPPTGMADGAKVILGALPPSVVPVRALAVSSDKSMIAAGRGNQIDVYDAGSGTFIRTLVDPKLTMPDGKPVKAAHLSIVESIAMSPDGKFIASGSFQEVKIWDMRTGTLRRTITEFVDRVVALAFGKGDLLATGGGAPSEDGELKVFDAATGKLVVDIKPCHSDTVYGVAFSPDAKMLVSGGADKFVKVFQIPSGKLVKSFEGHTHHVLDVGWKADGKLIASATRRPFDQGLGLRQGRADSHDQRPLGPDHAAGVYRDDAADRDLQRRRIGAHVERGKRRDHSPVRRRERFPLRGRRQSRRLHRRRGRPRRHRAALQRQERPHGQTTRAARRGRAQKVTPLAALSGSYTRNKIIKNMASRKIMIVKMEAAAVMNQPAVRLSGLG